MIKKSVLYCSVFLVLMSSEGYGQKKDSSNIVLKEVNITATRFKEENFQTAGSVSVLSSKTLQRYQARTAPEALMGTTGVFIQKTTHGAGSPFLRGLTGNQTLLLIDGIRLNNSTFRYGPNQYLNTIDPFIINQIEIFRGGGSVAYGSDALGGTIQLLTFEPSFSKKTEFHGKAVTKYATGDMEKTLRAETEITTDKVAIHFGASFNNFGNLIGGAETGEQSPSGYRQFSYDLKAVVKLKKEWDLIFSHHSLSQKHVPLFYRYQLENFAINEFNPQERQLSYVKLKGNNPNRWIKETSFTGSWQTTAEGRVSRKNNSNSLRTETDQVRTAGIIFNVLSAIKTNWTSNSGVEIYDDFVRSNKMDQLAPNMEPVMSRGLYPDGSNFLSYAIYSLQRINLNRLQFTFGGRFNGFKLKIPNETLGKVNVNPSAIVGNASATYAIANTSNVYASFNSGFRAPNIDDMGTLGIVDFRYELPAYDLKPERSYNFEAGYKFNNQKFSLALALFQQNLHNLITRVQVTGEKMNGIDVYRKENVERAYIRGAELEFEFKLNNYWRMYSSGTYLHGQNSTKNEPVRRIPPLNGRIGLEYRLSKWFISTENLFADKQTRLAAGDLSDNRIAKGGTAGWTIFNLISGYDEKNFSIHVAAQNLTNKDYRIHGSGINGVGRSLWLTFTGRF